jgi:octaprenyl-diphosphate synthase
MLAAKTPVGGEVMTSPTKAELNRSWKHLVEPVEPFLEKVTERLIEQANAFDPQIVPYAKYALNGSGKHLRPTLVALVAGSLGGVSDDHVTAAVIIEMVHLATLVHDDIMDEAEIRRGQLTLASNWGNEIAVLFGDCLFARALELAASFPTPEVCRAVATATNTVCAGEILQTQSRRKFAMSRDEYFRVIGMKTGELFTLSCDLAAFLSGATAEQRKTLGQFGAAFGTAYQIFDDCVDLFGTESEAGKSLGTDLEKGKLTWPLLLAWERSSPEDRMHLENMIQKWQPEHFGEVNRLLLKYETFQPSLQIIKDYLDESRAALHCLPDSVGRTGLLGLTNYLAQQTGVLVV